MIHGGCKRQLNGPGWLGFCCFSFFFSICSSSPMSATIIRVGAGSFALSPLITFFSFLGFLSCFSLFLVLMRADPTVAGLGYSLIYILYKNLLLPLQGQHVPTPRKEGRRKDMGKGMGSRHRGQTPSNPSWASMRT